ESSNPEKRVFYYDPNYPLIKLISQGFETYGTFRNGTYSYGPFNQVWSIRPSVSIDNKAQVILHAIKEYFQGLFQKADATIIMGSTPVSIGVVSLSANLPTMVLRDPQGRRIGLVSGTLVNEIPGATIDSYAGFYFFSVPRNNVYSIEARDMGSVNFSLFA